MHDRHSCVDVAVIAPDDPVDATLPARIAAALARHPTPTVRVERHSGQEPLGPGHDLVCVIGSDAGAAIDGAELAADARRLGIPIVGIDPNVVPGLEPTDCAVAVATSAFAATRLLAWGTPPQRCRHWQPGIDPEAFGPGHYETRWAPRSSDGVLTLIIGDHAQPGRWEDALAAALAVEPRLELVRLGGDPGLGRAARYASADLLVHLGASSAYPLAVVEAQASGLAVIARADAGACGIIEAGRTGVLIPPQPAALREALVTLARRPALRERLALGGLTAVRRRTWADAIGELIAIWRTVPGRRDEPAALVSAA
ncbi:glycosyltransferase [Conexibacter sp. DBS9H8]|uniref:glycosyltransferase n=1 Tax=Conexibacter sp. DBS9H8 TaxID=2937801 RepID=UPI00200F1067|nr:glycosyltransferase [Conexibacter sp. DBS9H8]